MEKYLSFVECAALLLALLDIIQAIHLWAFHEYLAKTNIKAAPEVATPAVVGCRSNNPGCGR